MVNLSNIELEKIKPLLECKIRELEFNIEEDSWTSIDDIEDREKIIKEIEIYKNILNKINK